MGLRLRFLCWWTPNWVLGRELDNVSRVTTAALKQLVAAYAPRSQIQKKNLTQSAKTLEEKRLAMAEEHAMLVEALATAVGQEETLRLGREALFKVGKSLGIESRDKLGVGNNPKDLIRAATILYRVLGIEFKVEPLDKTQATLIVNRCALSRRYSEFTCRVLSATDEGVVKGLDPQANMTFREVLTSGCKECRARIEF